MVRSFLIVDGREPECCLSIEDMPEKNVAEPTEPKVPSAVPDELLARTLTSEEIEDQTDPSGRDIPVTFQTIDYPVDALVKRLERGTMIIPQFDAPNEKVQTTLFQRQFVWTKKQMDRFIESLLRGYPVPGIFLVRQNPDNKLLVLDGQQRLETLRRFYKGVHNERVFSLQYVAPEFQKLTYETLPEELQNILDDSFMQATIVSVSDDDSYEAAYQIFERLNSGGTQLTPHEVRIALFSGDLMGRIAELNDDSAWRYLYGPRNSRLRDHELITRILALAEREEEYRRPLKTFLNDFTQDFRNAPDRLEPLSEGFLETAKLLADQVGPSAFRRTENGQVNGAQAEAIMVALITAEDRSVCASDLAERVQLLQSDREFVNATTKATADNEAVRSRLERARDILLANEDQE